MPSAGRAPAPFRRPKSVQFVAKMVMPAGWRRPKDRHALEVAIEEAFDPIRYRLDQELAPRGPILGYDVDPKKQRVSIEVIAHQAPATLEWLQRIAGLSGLRQALELD